MIDLKELFGRAELHMNELLEVRRQVADEIHDRVTRLVEFKQNNPDIYRGWYDRYDGPVEPENISLEGLADGDIIFEWTDDDYDTQTLEVSPEYLADPDAWEDEQLKKHAGAARAARLDAIDRATADLERARAKLAALDTP